MRRLAENLLGLPHSGSHQLRRTVAHLGYFHAAFVTRRKWLSEADYADLVALCQFLPGPASSQVGIAIGHMRAGLPGAIAAFVAFTAPSVVLLYLFWLGVGRWHGQMVEGLLRGLKIAALAVVAPPPPPPQAVWQMSQNLAPDWPRRLIALAAAALVLSVPSSATPILVIAVAAVAGSLLPAPTPVQTRSLSAPILPLSRPSLSLRRCS